MESENGMSEDQSQCIIALTYSNIPQMKKEIPAIIVGILTHRHLEEQLNEMYFLKKERIIHKKNSLLYLESITSELSDFIRDLEITTLPKAGFSLEKVQSSYHEILTKLIKGTLYEFQNPTIYVRKIIGPGFTEVSLPIEFPENAKIIHCTSKTPNSFFQLARLVARLHYEKNKKINSTEIKRKILSIGKSSFQIFRVVWNSPFVDLYNNDKVGVPNLLIREYGEKRPILKPLKIGSKISIEPIAKFCIGTEKDNSFALCSNNYKFSEEWGVLLLNTIYERCYQCSEKAKHLRCIYQRPACTGYEVTCNNFSFAGNYCLSPHVIYVTKYGKTLKIGTSNYSSVIGRLLNQGASSAIIFSPIKDIKLASDLEIAITKKLKEDFLPEYNDQVLNALFAGPRIIERLNSFLNNWNNSNERLLNIVQKFLLNSKINVNNEILTFTDAIIESFFVNLLDCYEKPDNIKAYTLKNNNIKKNILSYDHYNGYVNGYRGHFVFLSNDNILDLKSLQGYVVGGTING